MPADVLGMLNTLPKHTGTLDELLAEIGAPSAAQVAGALGVSRRTVERWKRTGAPRMALLSLWWLSRQGHSVWDAEMANRTAQALGMHAAMWREIARLRSLAGLEDAGTVGKVARLGRAANELGAAPVQRSRSLRRAPQGYRPGPR